MRKRILGAVLSALFIFYAALPCSIKPAESNDITDSAIYFDKHLNHDTYLSFTDVSEPCVSPCTDVASMFKKESCALENDELGDNSNVQNPSLDKDGVKQGNAEINAEKTVCALSEDVKVSSRILELLFGKKEKKRQSVALGGNVFGVKLKQSYVTIANADELPALSRGDVILSINGSQIHSVSEAQRLISESGGKNVTLRVKHKGNDMSIELKPKMTDDGYKLGLTLRDSAMGIGTVTYFDPKTGEFGGLGHGICDGESGEIIKMSSGEITGAIIGGIRKGESGKPGELMGILTDDADGELTSNNGCGVFGVLTDIPRDYKLVEIGTKSDIHEGDATIVSTLKNGKRAEYKVRIYDIDRSSAGSKSFRIQVTDKVLCELTGGIVRGMSGSPIIQNGKLVGAVTHVMVADPTEGYGIFIENMLSAASEGALPKAA